MDELEKLREGKLNKLMKKTEGSKIETEIEADDGNFEENVVEKSKKVPVVADFWAPWCAPCHMFSPVLEELAKEYNGKFVLAKINVDGARAASQKLGIISIPTVKMFKNGKIVDEFVGARPKDTIKGWLDQNLGLNLIKL